MAWLLFLDESGHDHKQMPYEVRGGIAIQDERLWPFTQSMQQLERDSFGCRLHDFQKELKGTTLLDKKRFRFARQAPNMPPEERRKYTRSFLMKGVQKLQPTGNEFCAYGQACIEMARGIFQLLCSNKAKLFASVIPRGTGKESADTVEFLRKDKIYLLERFYYFLEQEHESGLLVFDGTDKHLDRKFVRQMEAYFTKTTPGRQRTQWIVPTPFFVSSDMTYPVQTADLCIYCINWGFRLPAQGMNEPVREEIQSEFYEWLRQLQFVGEGWKDGNVFKTWGICYVPNPCGPGRIGQDGT